MRRWSATDFGGAAIIEVLKAAGGGQVTGAPGGEAGEGVRGGTATEETGEKDS